MSITEQLSQHQHLPRRRELIPLTQERLEHIRIFAELAAVGIGPTSLPFVPGRTTRRFAPARSLHVVPDPVADAQLH